MGGLVICTERQAAVISERSFDWARSMTAIQPTQVSMWSIQIAGYLFQSEVGLGLVKHT